MNQDLIQIGMLVIFIGIIILFIGAFSAAMKEKNSNVKFSVFGLFGFIPFGFSNDRRLFYFSIIITAILAVFAVLFFYRALR